MSRYECTAKIILTTTEDEAVTDKELAEMVLAAEWELNNIGFYESTGAGKVGIRVHIGGDKLPKKVW